VLLTKTQTGPWSELKIYSTAIRSRVFIEEQKIPSAIELDGNDQDYWHIVIFTNNKAIATARLANSGLFGRMAVLEPYRHKGIGSLLLQSISNKAIALKLQTINCHAQLSAVNFYKKNGFLVAGNPYQEAGLVHIKMLKNLP